MREIEISLLILLKENQQTPKIKINGRLTKNNFLKYQKSKKLKIKIKIKIVTEKFKKEPAKMPVRKTKLKIKNF